MAATIDDETGKKCTAVAGAIIARLRREPPPELWHYTTGEGLIKIIESGELWSTQVSCLNDATEYRYAIGAARAAFQQRLASDSTLSADHR